MEWINIIVALVSIILAIIAIILAFKQTAKAEEYHSKTKDLLNEIDKRASLTETKVSEHFDTLLKTVTDMANRASPSTEDKAISKLLDMFFKNPDKMISFMEKIQKIQKESK